MINNSFLTNFVQKKERMIFDNFKRRNNYPNLTDDEYQTVLKNKQAKESKYITYALCGAVGLLAIITGGFIALASGKCDKLINNILSLSCKPIDKFKEFLHNTTKAKISKRMDFTKARAHLQHIGTNEQGVISGAHEISECIQTLKEKGGNIISIKESKTCNGIWEIMYEIAGKQPEEPKSIYIKEQLSRTTIRDLLDLCSAHASKDLDEASVKLIHSKTTTTPEDMKKTAEKALQDGHIVKLKALQAKRTKAEQDVSRYTEIKETKRKQLEEAEKEYNKKKDALNALKKKADFNPRSAEFKKLLEEQTSARDAKISLEGELSSIESKLEKTKKHLKHLEHSYNIYGEKDGKLFAAFAHDEEGKIIVDSYFPITHGSDMQNEFNEILLDENKRAFFNIKYLIGAKKSQIEAVYKKIISKLCNKKTFMNFCAGSGIGAGIITNNIAVVELKKLNKEKSKTTLVA